MGTSIVHDPDDMLDLDFEVDAILARVDAAGNPADRAGMARYGINVERAVGVRLSWLRELARELGRNHPRALALWASGRHEGRQLALLTVELGLVDRALVEAWVAELDSWDLCELACSEVFRRRPFAWELAQAWSARPEEFVKRAGFSLMNWLAVHAKRAPDADFEPFLEAVLREAGEERHLVLKSMSAALRKTGSRNAALRLRAMAVAEALVAQPARGGRWVGRDALRRLARPELAAWVQRREGIGG